MNPPGHDAPDSSARASILLACGLIPLLALFPPETRGESMAGAAALITVLVLIRPAAFAGRRGVWLAVAAALSLVAWGAALAPGAAVEPTSVALLAVALGLAVSTLGPTLAGRLARVLAASAAIAGVHAVYQRLWGLERMARLVAEQPGLPDGEAIAIRIEQGRAFAAFPTPAALGGLLALSLPVTVVLAYSARGWRRSAWWGCVALQAAGMLCAASATATAALLAALALGWLARRGTWRATLAGVGGVAVLLVLVVVMRGGAVTDLHGRDSPWRLRAGNMRIARAMALEHPGLGVGPGGYGELYAQYRRPGDNETRHAHDLPLELAAEWGLPLGAGLSAGFFAIFLAPLARRRHGATIDRGLAVGLAAFALHNLADFTAFLPSLCWLAAALRGALVRPDGPAAQPVSLVTSLRPRPGIAGLAVVGCVAAAIAAAGSGLGRESRIAARAAIWDGRVADAERLVTQATRLAPWDVDAIALAARIASASETAPEQALERADRAVALSPVRASLRGLRARIRAEAGDAPGALADLEEAVRRSPQVGDYALAAERFRARLAESIAVATGGGT